jgi:hypothetical protein
MAPLLSCHANIRQPSPFLVTGAIRTAVGLTARVKPLEKPLHFSFGQLDTHVLQEQTKLVLVYFTAIVRVEHLQLTPYVTVGRAVDKRYNHPPQTHLADGEVR